MQPKLAMRSLLCAVVLGIFCSYSYSQNCYKPITGPNVVVGTVGNAGDLCVTQLCLGSGFQNLQNVIDDDVTTGTINGNLATVLNNNGVAVKNVGTVYPAGYVAGYLFSSGEVVSAGLLNGFTVSTYLNGVFQESKTVGNLLSANIFTTSMQKFYATFITTKSFDEVRFRTVGLSANILNGIKIYSAFAFPQTGCPLTGLPECNNIIPGEVNYDGPAICVGCTLTNADNINDDDVNNYASMYTVASAISSPSVGVLYTKGVFPAGYTTGFVISPDNNNSLVMADILNSATIETYLFGQKQESVTSTNGNNGALLSIKLLSHSQSLVNKIGFTTTKPFNEVRYRQNQLANATVGRTKIYYAYAEPESYLSCKKYLGASPSGKFSGSKVPNKNGFFGIGGYTYNGTYGLALQSLTHIDNVITPSTTDYATYNAAFVAGILNGARITVKNDGTLFSAGTIAGYDIMQQGGLFNIGLLNNITIRTYKVSGSNVTLQETSVGTSQLLGIDVLGGNYQQASVGFITKKPFNAVQIDISSGIITAGLGGATRIIGATIFEDADGDGIGDCVDVCSGITPNRTVFVDEEKEETGNIHDIKVYPNPAQNQVTVSGLSQGTVISLYNGTGQLLSAVKTKSITQNLDISKYTPGNYLIVVTDLTGNKSVLKLQKNK